MYNIINKMTEYYEILGLDKKASPEDIKKAFKVNAMKLHPDKNLDDPEASKKFQKLNEAYSILSDSDKKNHYDRFGTMDNHHGGGGGGPTDMNDILNSMFGGMGMGGARGGGMPGGFSFSFSSEDGGGNGPDIFNMFGGGGGRQRVPVDMVEVGVDINDIYYGNNKRVEFEMLELCDACSGTGALDPSQVINCLTCKGECYVIQQMGPFIQKIKCPSCGGNGSTIKNNKVCLKCKGGKSFFNKKIFDLKLPKGVPNNYEVKMDKKGSYDAELKRVRDIIFKFKYNIAAPYILDDQGNVTFIHTISIEDLLCGFTKLIKIYKEDIILKSDKYFNPNKTVTLKNQGILNSKKNKNSDLIIKFVVEFTESERLSKYNDVLQKVLKRQDTNDINTDGKTIIDISSLL